MNIPRHPMADQYLPWFITAPGQSDPLYQVTTVLVVASIVGLGVLFFTLHSLPERMGHKKLQFEIVAVLGLISLFTHEHIFWILGLLLALVDLPDFTTPLKRMSQALETIAGITPPEPAPAAPAGHDTIHSEPEQLREAKEERLEALRKGHGEPGLGRKDHAGHPQKPKSGA